MESFRTAVLTVQERRGTNIQEMAERITDDEDTIQLHYHSRSPSPEPATGESDPKRPCNDLKDVPTQPQPLQQQPLQQQPHQQQHYPPWQSTHRPTPLKPDQPKQSVHSRLGRSDYGRRCRFNHCTMTSLDGCNGCRDHACAIPGCKRIRRMDRVYCADHVCTADNCHSAVCEQTGFCHTHLCSFKDCAEGKSYCEKYCVRHRCEMLGCHNLREPNCGLCGWCTERRMQQQQQQMFAPANVAAYY